MTNFTARESYINSSFRNLLWTLYEPTFVFENDEFHSMWIIHKFVIPKPSLNPIRTFACFWKWRILKHLNHTQILHSETFPEHYTNLHRFLEMTNFTARESYMNSSFRKLLCEEATAISIRSVDESEMLAWWTRVRECEAVQSTKKWKCCDSRYLSAFMWNRGAHQINNNSRVLRTLYVHEDHWALLQSMSMRALSIATEHAL